MLKLQESMEYILHLTQIEKSYSQVISLIKLIQLQKR